MADSEDAGYKDRAEWSGNLPYPTGHRLSGEANSREVESRQKKKGASATLGNLHGIGHRHG